MRNTWHLQFERPELTEEERSFPFSNLYYRPLEGPDANVIYDIEYGAPMDPKHAILDLKDLLKPGVPERANGYCYLPNGGAFICVRTMYPGLKIDMYDYWRKWRFAGGSYAENQMRYKLWNPGSHVTEVLGTGETIEDIGQGNILLKILSRLTPDMLFEKEEFENSPIVGIFGGYGEVGVIGDDRKYPYVGLHHTREVEGGFEIRSMFWFGYTLEDKQLKYVMPEDVELDKDFPYVYVHHSANEMANLRSLLPVVWESRAADAWEEKK